MSGDFRELTPILCARRTCRKTILPAHCQSIFITNAGFRSTWFTLLGARLLDSMGYGWIGHIRNRDMVRPAEGELAWRGGKTLYAKATGEPKDLVRFHYVRSHPVAYRLVLLERKPKGRHHATVHKKHIRKARGAPCGEPHKRRATLRRARPRRENGESFPEIA